MSVDKVSFCKWSTAEKVIVGKFVSKTKNNNNSEKRII